MDRFLQSRLKPANPAESRQTLAQAQHRRTIARIILAVIVAIDLILGLYVLRMYYVHPRTDDAYVRANTIGVAPQVSGTIVALPVRDNQHVKKGDLLFVVDPRPYQAELDLATAQLALTELQIGALSHALAAARARQERAQADADYDRQYLARIGPLLKDEFVTANQVADARMPELRAREQSARAELQAILDQAADRMSLLQTVKNPDRFPSAAARVGAIAGNRRSPKNRPPPCQRHPGGQ